MRATARVANDLRQTFGITGEDLAAAELARRGYAILERRYRTRHGEIDIIARDGATLVFVEVKARASREFGGAAAAVKPMKQRRVVQMAVDYLALRRLAGSPCRFDVVAIDYDTGEPVITVYPNAFGY